MSVLHPVFDVPAQTPILTIFLVIGLGTAVGQMSLGSIRLGAAGALFMGLAVGALSPRFDADLTLLRSLGLAPFCYTVRLAVGNAFFHDLRRQLSLMALCVVVLMIAGAAGGLYSHLTGVSPAVDSGAYARVLTLPVSSAAVETVGTQKPAVDHTLACLAGVAVTILITIRVVGRIWPRRRDPRPVSVDDITATGVYLLQRVALGEVKAFKEGRVCISYLGHDDETRVAAPGEELLPGDKVVIVGALVAVESVIHDLGTGLHDCLVKDRTATDFRRLTVSSTRVVERTIAEVDMPGRFQSITTHIKRDDLDLPAREDLALELDDRVLAVVPSDELEKAVDWFGDSERSITQIDASPVEVGVTLGVLLGLVAILLLGGITLRFEVTTGPPVVGMALGWVGYTESFVRGLPYAANSIIRQLGLLFFLAAIGLTSGPDLAAPAFSMARLKVGVLVVLTMMVNAIALLAEARWVGVSAQCASGGLAGLVGQPATLTFVLSKRGDERIEAGHATLFTLTIAVRIVMVQVLVMLWARSLMVVGGGASPGHRVRSE